KERIETALKWLKEHPQHAEVRKWNTQEWGEIPADFNRK
ncbi:MAG: ribonuclease H, partial [Bacteroidales bacterium]